MITFEDVDITNLRRKNSKKKLRNPVNRNYKEALFLAIENKSTFKSAIYTCTYTYNYDKVRASYIYARKETSRGPMVNYFAVENTTVTGWFSF